MDALLKDCYVCVTENRLVVGNSRIERSWDCQNGHFGTISLKDRVSGREWISAAHGGAETVICHANGSFNLASSTCFDLVDIAATVEPESPLTTAHIHTVVTLKTSQKGLPRGEDHFTVEKHIIIYPGVPAIRSYLEISADAEFEGLAPSIMDTLQLEARELLARSIQLHDDTDNTNLLVTKRQRRVLKRMAQGFVGNILLVADGLSDEGIFLVKESPVHDSQLFPLTYDLRVNPLSVMGIGFDRIGPGRPRRSYGAVVGVHQGGEDCGIVALKEYQQARYRLIPERDYMISANPWEGHLQHIDEGIILKELDRAREMGLTHFQIDYGWFDHYMTGFHREKFPHQLAEVRQRADEYGIQLGLWMNPMGIWSESATVQNHADWVARDHQGQPVESFRFVDPVVGMDLCHEDYFTYIKQLIIDYHERCGVANFKMDMFQLDRYDTQYGDLYDHCAAYEQLQQELRQLHPDICFIQDVTVGKRPSYDYALEYGIIMLENRYLIDRANRYYPHQTLNNLWQLAPYIPPQKLLIETHHDAPGHSPSYTFAIAMFANPLFWEALTAISSEDLRQLQSLIAIYKQHRDAIFAGHILPIGDEPSGSSWTGFQSHNFARAGGYAIIFREANPEEERAFHLSFLDEKAVRFYSLTDSTPEIVKPPSAPEVAFRLPHEKSFRLYQYTTA